MRLRGGSLVVLSVWFIAMTGVGASLLARHVVPLPAPSAESALGRKLAWLREPHRPPTWLAVHVLASECSCSAQVLTHLTSTVRPGDWSEAVLWVGAGHPAPALGDHFRVHSETVQALAQQGIEAAPMLILISPEGETRYAGGYTDHKQGPVNHDLELMAQVRAATPPRVLPVFGCAVSDRLKRLLTLVPGV